MSKIIFLDKLEDFNALPGLKAKVVHSENQTLAFWEIEAGTELPSHSHPHEQIAILTEGEFKLTIEGKESIMKAGMLAIIPSHAEHSGLAVTACKITDVFYPCREDFPQ